jgi:hypothetical protein
MWLGGATSVAAGLAAQRMPVETVLPWVRGGEIAEQLGVWAALAGAGVFLGDYLRTLAEVRARPAA